MTWVELTKYEPQLFIMNKDDSIWLCWAQTKPNQAEPTNQKVVEPMWPNLPILLKWAKWCRRTNWLSRVIWSGQQLAANYNYLRSASYHLTHLHNRFIETPFVEMKTSKLRSCTVVNPCLQLSGAWCDAAQGVTRSAGVHLAVGIARRPCVISPHSTAAAALLTQSGGWWG